MPAYLATSPILSDGAALMGAQLGKGLARHSDPAAGPPVQALGPLQSAGEKKRRKRRRKSKVDSLKREDSAKSSADEDMFPIEMSSDEEKEMDSSRWGGDYYNSEAHSAHVFKTVHFPFNVEVFSEFDAREFSWNTPMSDMFPIRPKFILRYTGHITPCWPKIKA